MRGFSPSQKETIGFADAVLHPKQEQISETSAAHQAVLKEEHSALKSADISKLQTVEVAQ